MSFARLTALAADSRARVAPHQPQIRAVLVLLHVLVIVIAAVPTPHGSGSREALATPAAQEELRAWSARLHVSPEWLAEHAASAAETADRIHDGALRPFEPYLEVTGAWQPWALFIAPNRWPTRFQVQALPAHARWNQWQTVFEEGSPNNQWHTRALTHERTRSYFELASWPRFVWLGPSVCTWAAHRLFEERADVQRVRCRAFRALSPSPEQAARGEINPGEWLHVYETARPRR